MAYSPGDLSSLLLNGSNEPPRTRTLGGGMTLFRIVGGGSAREVLEEGYGLGLELLGLGLGLVLTLMDIKGA